MGFFIVLQEIVKGRKFLPTAEKVTHKTCLDLWKIVISRRLVREWFGSCHDNAAGFVSMVTVYEA
jgi:hypothetical protein